MEKEYYILINDAKSGPFTLDELRNKNLVSNKTLVWYEGMTKWENAYNMYEFKDFTTITYVPEERSEIVKNEVHKPFFLISILISVGIMIWLYLFNFDNYSETELVNLSFIWFPFLFFGITGYICINKGCTNPIRRAFLFAIISTAFLIFFFLSFWSAL